MTPRRSLLLVLPAIALTLAACGGPPKGDVAVIKTDSGDVDVSQGQFDRFFKAASQQVQQTATPTALVAPDFKVCVDAKRKALPKDSQRANTESLRKECQKQYDTVRNTAMQQLIQLNWIKGEAERRGLTLRKAEIARELNTIITQQFQGQKGYQAFLKQSGFTVADVDLNIVAEVAKAKIVAQLQKETKEPNDADVRRYFNEKKSTYVQPETRDLRLIKAKDEADAKAALAAIKAGQSWTATAKRYSTDAASKDQGGKVLATVASQQPTQFASTVFKAKKNALLGPIKTPLGWYVVKVQNITPEKQPDFNQLKDQLKASLASENQQKAVTTFQTQWTKRWASRTKCAKDYDQLTYCDQDPAPPTDPATGQQTADRPTPRDGGTGLPKDAPRRPAPAVDPSQLQQQVQTG